MARLFERVRLDRFIGREWLIAEIDAFLQEDRGYFVLEAAAGLGKTTFLAYLAKEWGYIHHFVELAPGQDGIAPGLRNLAAQLVCAWDLNPYLAEGVLPGAASCTDFLQSLLAETAQKRDETRPDEKIVLLVDALDEAGVPLVGQNVLGLPLVLPRGVYFIFGFFAELRMSEMKVLLPGSLAMSNALLPYPTVNFRPTWGHRFSAKVVHSQRWRTGNSC